jgi:hypothetical protein
MNVDPDKNLERWADERLRALPELPAPRTLIPDVMRRIAAQQTKVWWRRAWPEWPRGMQLLSFAVVAAALCAGWYYGGAYNVSTDGLTSHVGGALSFLRPIWTFVTALAGAFHVLVSSIKTEYMIIGVALVGTLYLMAVALGSLCFRLATVRNHRF